MTHSYPTRRSSDLLDIGSTGENAVVDGIALGDHRCPHARLIGGKTTRQIPPPVAFRIGAALLLPPPRIVQHRHRAVHSAVPERSEEHTSELHSLMRISYAVFCLKKKNTHKPPPPHTTK